MNKYFLILFFLLLFGFFFPGCEFKENNETDTPATDDEPVTDDPVIVGDDDFSIIILPDTQSYVKWMRGIFLAQTDWIVNNKDSMNIKFVLHEGDIVQSYDDIDEELEVSEWEFSVSCMNFLDTVNIPYALVPGNHDYARNDARDSEMFNAYFPISKFSSMPTYGGAHAVDKSDNTYHLLTAGNLNLIILMLEFGPRNNVISWANTVLTNYPARIAIIVTHAYLNGDNSRLGLNSPHSPTNGYGLPANDTNDGVDIWENFISLHENIKFVFSGHVREDNDGTAILITPNVNNEPVYQIMANFQYMPWDESGHLLIMTFKTNESKICIRTYSPWLDTYKTSAENQFDINNVLYF